jgi:hypothetical protein
MFSNYWLPLFKSGHFSGRALPLPNLAAAGVSPRASLRGRVSQSQPYLPVFVSPSTASPASASKEIRSFTPSRLTPLKPACQLKLSGRLNGVSKARLMSWRTGALKPQTITSKIGYYNRQIFTKWGTLGLKLLVS